MNWRCVSHFFRYCKGEPDWEKKPHDLASINHTYTRNLDEWKWLCRGCHMKSDIANGLRGATIVNAKRIRGEYGRYIKTNLPSL